jgi:perosamine synthetase
MTERRIPVAEPVLGQEELDNVVAAMRSGWISSLGAFIPEFEREFAAFSGAAHGVAVANGTVALHLALVAAGVGPGDEVLMPSLTFVATASAVRYCGALPVFVDSDLETWQLDPAALEVKITSRTKAVIPVHLYGHPCDLDAIRAIAARHGVTVIEDAAEAHGAQYRGRPVGALGAIGCFSFYGNKIITTGEGGMCLTNDPATAEHLRLLRDHGMDPKRPYWHDIVGFNYRMTNLQAAVGVAQVKRIAGFIEKKREMAAWYAEALAPLARAGRITLQPEAPWARSVFWMSSVVLADTAVSVEQVRARMSDHGVDTRPFFHPAHLLPPYATGERLPVAEHLASHGINLPSGTCLVRDEVERAARALSDALDAR